MDPFLRCRDTREQEEIDGRHAQGDADLSAARPRLQPLRQDGRADEEHAKHKDALEHAALAQGVCQRACQTEGRIDRCHYDQRPEPEAAFST